MNRVVFITGASSGIGRAAALRFAKAGYHVAGMARRAERLEELAHLIEHETGNFLPLVGDVTKAEDVETCVARTLEHFGRLDVLIANAGIGLRGALVDAQWQDLETLLRTNIDGVLHSVRAAIPAMRRSGGGHILTISSVAYNLVSPYAAVYAASKAFVTNLAHSLRMELEDDQILVTDFLVGRTATEFNERRLGTGKRTGQSIPTMPPEQVAEALLSVVGKRRRSVILRFFDRMLVLGSALAPDWVGRMARREYR